MIVIYFQKNIKDNTNNQNRFQDPQNAAAQFVHPTQKGKVGYGREEFGQKINANHHHDKSQYKGGNLNGFRIPGNVAPDYGFHQIRKLKRNINPNQ